MTEAIRQVGFTGTQRGMTDPQRDKVRLLLQRRLFVAHHGACVGADEQFDAIVRTCPGLYWVHIYPSTIVERRTYLPVTQHDITELPAPPLMRNRRIVAACDVLIATPKEANMQERSGTWATVRYAKLAAKPNIIILPNGATWSEGVTGLYT